MQILGQHAAANSGIGRIAVIEPAQLVRLEKLQPTDVINFAGRADGLMARAGDLEIVRLLMVRLVARRDVAADDERQLVRDQITLKIAHIDAGGGESGQFRIGHRHFKRHGPRPRAMTSTGSNSQRILVWVTRVSGLQ